MIEKSIINTLNSVKPENLARVQELGTHYNFQSSVPVMERYKEFLKEIVDGNVVGLTSDEIKLISNKIGELEHIQRRILDFNPKQSNSANQHQGILNTIRDHTESGYQELRPIYNFVKLETQDLQSTLQKAEDTLKRIEGAEKTVESAKTQIEQLPNQTEQRFNELYKQLQERLTTNETNLSQQINDSRKNLQRTVKDTTNEARQKSQEVIDRLNKITDEANQKIDEVLQQARKFSAKSALATYAEMFNIEANINQTEIRRWRLVLVCLSIIEIGVALWMFFFFLPEVLEISLMYGGDIIGIGWLISIFFVKVFVLSVIAVGINHSIKNLNALSNQYATNRFKANSLASFQAFLDATDKDEVIDNIIMRVSEAVYTHHISGFLSKDDTAIRSVDPGLLKSITKLTQ